MCFRSYVICGERVAYVCEETAVDMCEEGVDHEHNKVAEAAVVNR